MNIKRFFCIFLSTFLIVSSVSITVCNYKAYAEEIGMTTVEKILITAVTILGGVVYTTNADIENTAKSFGNFIVQQGKSLGQFVKGNSIVLSAEFLMLWNNYIAHVKSNNYQEVQAGLVVSGTMNIPAYGNQTIATLDSTVGSHTILAISCQGTSGWYANLKFIDSADGSNFTKYGNVSSMTYNITDNNGTKGVSCNGASMALTGSLILALYSEGGLTGPYSMTLPSTSVDLSVLGNAHAVDSKYQDDVLSTSADDVNLLIGKDVSTLAGEVADSNGYLKEIAGQVTDTNTGIQSLIQSIYDLPGKIAALPYVIINWLQLEFTWPATAVIDVTPLELDLKSKFPFCIPWDIYDSMSLLISNAEAPKWQITFPASIFIKDTTLTIDLSIFDEWASIIRWGEYALFCIGLFFLTKEVVQ